MRPDSTRSRVSHATTVWRRDMAGTRWAWSCVCGARYHADLPSKEAASAGGQSHVSAATSPQLPERTTTQ